jgi:predicted branched-subunit amino acid permease
VSDSAAPAQPDPEAPVTDAAWFLRGVRSALLSVQGMVLFAAMIGFGSLCQGVEFPIGASLLSVVLIWALPAQVLLVGGYAAGNAAPVIALAVGLSSVRLFPMTAAIMPYLRSPRGIGVQFLAAHFIAVTAWIEGMRQLPNILREARVPFFFGLSVTLVATSVVATLIGYFLAGALPQALAAGLLFLTPLSFLLQLSRNARDVVDRLALALGLLLAPFMAEIGGRLDLLWTGLVGGGLAWGIHRFLKHRQAKGPR